MLAAVVPQSSVSIVLTAGLVHCPTSFINWFCGDSSGIPVYLTTARAFAAAAVGFTEECRGLTQCMEAASSQIGPLAVVLTQTLYSRFSLRSNREKLEDG